MKQRDVEFGEQKLSTRLMQTKQLFAQQINTIKEKP